MMQAFNLNTEEVVASRSLSSRTACLTEQSQPSFFTCSNGDTDFQELMKTFKIQVVPLKSGNTAHPKETFKKDTATDFNSKCIS